jgi:hypothetical protein
MFARARAASGLAVLLAGLAGCTPYSNTKSESSAVDDRLSVESRERTKSLRLSEVRDIGAGIFVFPRSSSFPETLSDFLQAHPELKVVTVSQSADMTTGVFDQTDSRANSMIVVLEARGANLASPLKNARLSK